MRIVELALAGGLVLAVLVFMLVVSIALYLECIAPHLEEMRKRKGRITGIRLVVVREREPEVKEFYRRQSL